MPRRAKSELARRRMRWNRGLRASCAGHKLVQRWTVGNVSDERVADQFSASTRYLWVPWGT